MNERRQLKMVTSLTRRIWYLLPVLTTWGGRNEGRGFNSNTGHAAVIGKKNKMCHSCDEAKKAGKQPNDHDCRKIHSGSSKSMEPLAAVELSNKATKSNVKLSIYTGNNDSMTESHLKQKVPYDVEKWSDTVHIKRSLTTRLYNLSQRSKFPNSSVLSQKVMNYLVKSFTYCIAQNKGEATNMKSAIQSIVPHAFGDHTGCRETWCRYKNELSHYCHRDLPYGKDRQGDNLQSALMNIAQTVINKPAPAANSQHNESLNSVAGSKNPKIWGSESNDNRVSCSVSQVNLGYRYVPRTLASLNIEPGFFCVDHNTKMDKKKSKGKQRKSTVAFKRRPSQLHKHQISETSKNEGKEGTMYESGIGLNLNSSATSMELNNSELSITDPYDITANIAKQQQEQYGNAVPKYTSRPTV